MGKHCSIFGLAFLFLGLMPATAQPPGDASGDGTLSFYDAKLIEDHIIGKSLLDPAALARSDANGDGVVDVADVIHVQLNPSPPVIDATVLFIDEDADWIIEAVTDDSVTLRWTGPPPAPIQVGSVFFSSLNGGFLRRALSITPVGDSLLIMTEDAALTDLIISGSFDIAASPPPPPAKAGGFSYNMSACGGPLSGVPLNVSANLVRADADFNLNPTFVRAAWEGVSCEMIIRLW